MLTKQAEPRRKNFAPYLSGSAQRRYRYTAKPLPSLELFSFKMKYFPVYFIHF